jgi:hypothetical protein
VCRIAELENIVSTLEDRLRKSEEQNWILIQESNQTKATVSRFMEALHPDTECRGPIQVTSSESSYVLGDVSHYSTASHILEYATSGQDLDLMLGTSEHLDLLEEPTMEMPIDYQRVVSTPPLVISGTGHGPVDRKRGRIRFLNTGDSKFEDFEEDDVQELHDVVSLLARPAQHNFQDPIWAMLPNISTPTSSLDLAIFNIIGEGVQLRLSYLAVERSSSIATAIASVLTPSPVANIYPICSLVLRQTMCLYGTDFAGKLADFVAVLYIFYAIIKWRVMPSPECYQSVPYWMRPTTDQIVTAHPAWIDTFPWPGGRERLTKSFDNSMFDDRFCRLCAPTVSVNWKQPSVGLFVRDKSTGLTLNPEFESHLKNLDNWTVGASLLEAFPVLSGIDVSSMRFND